MPDSERRSTVGEHSRPRTSRCSSSRSGRSTSGITLTMRCMTDYNPGDVVLIPFPFTDLSTVKQRPAIILSSTAFNHHHQGAILAAISRTLKVRGGIISQANRYLGG